jgi:hypothetical protein
VKLTDITTECPFAVRHAHDTLKLKYKGAEFHVNDAIKHLAFTLELPVRRAERLVKDIRKWGGFYT